MTRSKANKPKSRAVNTLFEKGVLALCMGGAFLIAPIFLKGSAVLSGIAGALRMPGWIALIVGAGLLAVHFVAKGKVNQAGSSAKVESDLPPGKQDRKDVVQVTPVAAASAELPAPETPAPGAPAVHQKTRIAPTSWSPAVFSAIEWRRFEAMCEALFAQAGFQTRAQSHGADGGVDIWLHSANAQGPVSVVQCKHWQSKPVGVKEMREFFGVMSSHKLKRGTYATTSTYTADAQQFAMANGIHTLDGTALLALIAKRSPDQQTALLAVALEGEYWRPTCASCGIKLV